MPAIHTNTINALIDQQTNTCTRSGEAVEMGGGVCHRCGLSTMAHPDQRNDRDRIVADVLAESSNWTQEQVEDAIAIRLGFDRVAR